MPLKNRQEFEATDLKGVNLAADETKIPFGAFLSLANWIPSLLKALKKKRGVAKLDSVADPVANVCFEDDFIRTNCLTCPGTALGSCSCPGPASGTGLITVTNGCGWSTHFSPSPAPSALTLTNPTTLSCPSGSSTATAAGGVLPYSWLLSAGNLSLNPGQTVATVTAATNSGSGVAGVAYDAHWQYENGGVCDNATQRADWGCADQATACTSPAGHDHGNSKQLCATSGACSSAGCGNDCLCPGGSCASPGCTANRATCLSVFVFNDHRTGSMITQGCNPCMISMATAMLTVTDAVGQSVSKAIPILATV